MVCYEPFKHASTLLFSNTPLADFLFLLFVVLLEEKLIFISKKITLLTASVLVFSNLLKPFVWPYPIIFTLPYSLLTLLESPVSIMAGLNVSKNYISDNNLE